MKAHLALLAAVAVSTATQAQITITQANFPATATVVERYQGAALNSVSIPTTGANQTWDYSNATLSGGASMRAYFAPTANPSFPSATRAYNYQTTFGPVAVSGVQYHSLNANGLQDLGYFLPLQRISIRNITQGPNDSLIIPAQARPIAAANPSYLVKFPLTAGSVQRNTYRAFTDGLLTVALFGLNRTPMRAVQRITRVDSVAGWGVMRVPAVGGGSTVAIPVLQCRTRVVEVDSVYQNGQPAPPLLLAGLGLTQGQVLLNHYDHFYRASSGQILAQFFYPNRTFQTLSSANFSREADLVTGTRAGLAPLVGGLYAFPNPLQDGRLVIATGDAQAQPVALTVRDLTGRVLRTGAATTGQPTALLADLAAGTYLLTVQDRRGAASSLKVTVR